MNWRAKIVILSDRVICVLIVVLVLGSVLCFGGAVWWFRPMMSTGAFLLVAVKLAQSLVTGRMPILKSPLGMLGLLALGLGLVQLAPLPAGLASRLSPRAHEVYALGLLPRLVHADDAEAPLPEALRSDLRQASIGRRLCDGWWKLPPAWRSFGPYHITQTV